MNIDREREIPAVQQELQIAWKTAWRWRNAARAFNLFMIADKTYHVADNGDRVWVYYTREGKPGQYKVYDSLDEDAE